MPVVDSKDKLVGIVTIDDIIDVAEQATKDFQKIGGLEALDEPYMQISLWRMVRKRAGLAGLALGEMLTATAMGFFEKQIARAVVLALHSTHHLERCNSASGISLVIRALALGESDWWTGGVFAVRLSQVWRWEAFLARSVFASGDLVPLFQHLWSPLVAGCVYG